MVNHLLKPQKWLQINAHFSAGIKVAPLKES